MSHRSDRPIGDGSPASTRVPLFLPTLAPALIAVFIGALDLTVIATILPRIVSDLRINTADVDRYVWVVNGYLLAYLIAIPIVGKISDLIGRTPAFLLSLGVFAAGSIWCTVADDLTGLILGRAVQGAGGGAILPVTMALVGDVLPPAKRAAALGLVGAIDTLGWVLGPMWGAAIVRLLAGTDEPWRWVFAVNIPLGLLAAAAIIAARRFESAATNRSTRGRLDLLGTLLLAIALLGVNLALASGSEIGAAGGSGARALGGTRNPLADQAPLLLVAGLIAGVLFVLWERRARDPVLPLALFRHRRFSAAIVANFLVGAALIVAMVDTPVVVALLVDADRVSSVSALMLAPFTLLMAALSFAGGQLVRLRGERLTAAIGLALVAIGYVALWVGFRDRSYTAMIPGLAIAGAGFGLVIAPIGATTIEAAAASERGIAAGLTLVFRLLGMTIGISVLTSIAVRRLQTLVSRLDLPVRQPDESTAAFLLRQNEFITDRVIPLSLQVIRESFLIAGVLALVALVPISYISHRPTGDVD